jgi:tetratricopeptide (TPR) repeat protein
MKKPASKPKRTRQTQKPSSRKGAGSKIPNLLKTNRKSAEKEKGRSSKAASARLTKAGKAKAIPSPMRRQPTPEEIAYRATVARFESAVRLFNENHFAKARGAFERVAGAATPDLAQRAKVYLNICKQRLSRPAVNLKTADEHYNYGVQLANQGNLAEAEQHLTKALKLAPNCDYIHYALASTSALQDRAEDALAHLAHAIELNGRSRYLAQNDPDFSSLGEDPRFTELLYPEKPL